jgi:hypothetical protein
MKLMIVLLCFYSLQVMAGSEVWKLGDKFFEFNRDEKNSLLISKSCNQKCDAYKLLKKVSLKSLSSAKLTGGKNPGAVLCHESEGAEILFLKDLNGNDNSFCFLKDKSFVSSSSLEIAAGKNDAK